MGLFTDSNLVPKLLVLSSTGNKVRLDWLFWRGRKSLNWVLALNL